MKRVNLLSSAGNFFKKQQWYIRYSLYIIAVLIVSFIVLDIVFPLPYYKLEKDYSVLHLDSSGELLRITLSPSGKYRIKTPLKNIPEFLKKGILTYEDKYFYFHPGVNPVSVLRAAILNISHKKILSGASTITLQIAKLMEPKKRTIISKIIEAFRALQLEIKYSKKELLEIYLNSIPMGGNIEGVEAASYLYFNKPASKLTIGEAALLIALPKSPNKFRPDKDVNKAYIARKQVLLRIKDALKINRRVFEAALRENIPGKRFLNPYKLPHLVNRDFSEYGYIRKYFIDKSLQGVAEYNLRRAIKRLKKSGVYNGAVIIVDNRTSCVVAYVGSPDFSDKRHSGEIDMVVSLRPPGSAFKPFIYGLAIDRGLITPKKILFDIPREYDGYSPVNYGREFIGPVTALEALTRSLNSPAVELENILGKNGVMNLLLKCGITGSKRKKLNPGLSVVLGAYPVTLEELVMLYSGLANKGIVRRLKYVDDYKKNRKEKGVKILSEEAAYIISEMLALVQRPDLPQSWEFTKAKGKVAFKTGTSFGLRDAWCIGYNPDYTVGVWLGNADNSFSFDLIGAKAAAPVVIEIFNFLTRYNDSWFAKPAKVKKRFVCPVSGDELNDFCDRKTEDYYIEGITPRKKCSLHRRIFVSKKTGKRVAPDKMKKNEEYIEKVIIDWPPEVATFLRQNGMLISDIPEYESAKVVDPNEYSPKILSPKNGSVYKITGAFKKKYQKIALKAAVSGGKSKVIWFVNGAPFKKCDADETVYLDPMPGDWKIIVQGPTGKIDSVRYRVVVAK